MNLESLKVGVRDIAAIGSIIVTIMVNYYSLRSEIRDVSSDFKLYDLRIKILETTVDKMQLDIDDLKQNQKNYDQQAVKQTGRR